MKLGDDVNPAQAKLKELLKFTADDLYENQQGYISESQKLYLLRFKRRYLYGFLLLVGLEVFFYMLAVYFPADREPSPELFFAIFGVMLILYIPLVLFAWWRMLADVQGGTVKTIRG